ncbi:MAG: hypothetical protein C0399_04085 [Syntrophus sp. (in: bacteria)]|nr:hypothetical protein [Syntrophus sp. (in: bacteria)]
MIGILTILIVVFIPWLIALIDILKSDFKGNNKIVWLLAVILIPFIGTIAYFVIGRRQKTERGIR